MNRENFTPSTEALLAFIHPDDRERIAAEMARANKTGVASSLRYRIIRRDGSERVLYAEGEAVRSESGEPLRVVAVIKDITEEAAAAERQIQLERQLQHSQRLEALGTLAGGIAHDLNNTLVPIQALSKTLMREMPANSTQRVDLETILHAGHQARDLVQQILAFSRKQEPAKNPIDLGSTARAALQIARAGMPHAIELIEDIAETPLMMADAGQLQQVIVNLVTNAAQAIGEASGRITVRVAPAPQRSGGAAGDILLSVTDTGCGMDQATAERIFEPFFTTKKVGEGTGLGLSVVHGIVASHGGKIEVRSKPGAGTEMIILLPPCADGEFVQAEQHAVA